MSGIAKFTPTAPQPTKPDLPKSQPGEYKGIVEDIKFTDLHKLSRYIEGYPLTVDFFGQILGEDNAPREVDPAQDTVYQQYYKINNLEIRVDKPLEITHDADTQLSDITGSANVYSDIRPNTWDYFTTRSTRGRIGLFRITDVDRNTINRDSSHRIDYKLVGYIDAADAKEQYVSLQKKINQEYYFDGERLSEGASPILKKQEYEYVSELRLDYRRIASYYFSTFHNHTYQTLVLPGQQQSIYDKMLTDFILRIVSVQDDPKVQYTKQLGSDHDRYLQQPQFWKAIAERNPLYIYQANKFMGLMNRAVFNRDSFIAGSGLSTIDKYVYPLQADMSTGLPADQQPYDALPGGISDTAGPNGQICTGGNNTFKSATGDVPLYKRVLVDIWYVLSRDFYETSNNWCLLEKVTWDYLSGRMIQLNELYALTKQYYSLARLEQFYYGPLLMTFIKDANFAQYTER